MRCVSVAFILLAAALVTSCGEAADEAVATTPLTAIATSTTGVSAPPTTAASTGDLTDPGQWLGHVYTEASMGAPFAVVSLDGVETTWVTAMISCGIPSPQLPPACPTFVRPDPGGYGHALEEPGTWMVLLRQMDAQNAMSPALVLDAVSEEVAEPGWMPTGMCSATDGSPGTFAGFVQYDPDYMPTGDAAKDDAAHPLMKAWSADGDHLVEQPLDAVKCSIYSYGD